MTLQQQLRRLIDKYGEEQVLSTLVHETEADISYSYQDVDAIYFGWDGMEYAENKRVKAV